MFTYLLTYLLTLFHYVIKNMRQTHITHKIAQQVNDYIEARYDYIENTKIRYRYQYIKSNSDLIINDCM